MHAKRFVDAAIETLSASNVFVLPLALCERSELVSQLLHNVWILRQVVEHVCKGCL